MVVAVIISKKVISDEPDKVTLDLNTFENFKGQLLDLNLLLNHNKSSSSSSRLTYNNSILSQINNYYGTNIDFDNRLKESKSAKEIFEWLTLNSDFNQRDIEILTNFSSNLALTDFDVAVSILEEDIYNENVEKSKIDKYESIINGIKLIEFQFPGFFIEKSTQKSCLWASAKLALATAALVAACNPPAAGATVGVSCYLAATSFIAASATVGMECGD